MIIRDYFASVLEQINSKRHKFIYNLLSPAFFLLIVVNIFINKPIIKKNKNPF